MPVSSRSTTPSPLLRPAWHRRRSQLNFPERQKVIDSRYSVTCKETWNVGMFIASKRRVTVAWLLKCDAPLDSCGFAVYQGECKVSTLINYSQTPNYQVTAISYSRGAANSTSLKYSAIFYFPWTLSQHCIAHRTSERPEGLTSHLLVGTSHDPRRTTWQRSQTQLR